MTAAFKIDGELEQAFQQLTEFRTFTKHTLKSARRFSETAKAFFTSSNLFADDLYNLQNVASTFSAQIPDSVVKSSVLLGCTLKAVGSTLQHMTEELEEFFVDPLDILVKYDFQELEEIRKRRDKLRSEFDEKYRRMASQVKPELVVAAGNDVDRTESSLECLFEEMEKKTATLSRTCASQFFNSVVRTSSSRIKYHEKSKDLLVKLAQKLETIKPPMLEYDDQPVKAGVLLKKSTVGTQKVYLVLKEKQLCQYISDKEFNPSRCLDVRTISVRHEKVSGTTLPLLEINSPALSAPIQLMAKNENEISEWVKSVNSAVSNALSASAVISTSNNANPLSLSEEEIVMIREIPAGNRFCADCRSPDPEWASINLGILVCLECSGMHRSLGSHISKVRSLHLDVWNPVTLLFLMSRGNLKSNKFFENKLSAFSGNPSISAQTPRAERENFIRRKYFNRDFVPSIVGNPNSSLWSFLSSVTENRLDVNIVLNLLCMGADVNSVNEKNLSAIHQALSLGSLNLLEILVQNGANLQVTDSRGWSLLHHCAFFNRPRSLAYLVELGLSKNERDLCGMSACDIAEWNHSSETFVLLKGQNAKNFELTRHMAIAMSTDIVAVGDTWSTPRLCDIPDVIERDFVKKKPQNVGSKQFTLSSQHRGASLK